MPGGGMMGWGGFGGYGMGFVGWLFMLLFWGLIIVGLVLLVRWLWDHGRSAANAGAGTGTAETPLEILKRRYARGEISKEEFDRMKQFGMGDPAVSCLSRRIPPVDVRTSLLGVSPIPVPSGASPRTTLPRPIVVVLCGVILIRCPQPA
jgi:putative membrane protein